MTIANSIVLSNNAYGTIASGLAVSDTALSFTTGHGARFPTLASGQVMYLTLVNSTNVVEVVAMTAHASGSDSATIARAAAGTSAKAWTAGDRIEGRLVTSVLTQLQQEAVKAIALTTADAGATYTGTTSPTQLGYVTPMVYAMTVATTNSGAGPTIAIDGLSAITVKLDGGTALVASQMPLNGLYLFDGTNFILLNPIVVSAVATQAQQETATSIVAAVTPGRQHFHPGMPKAWGYITHPSTVTASYPATGVSVSYLTTGSYTITHGVTFSSTSYCIVLTGGHATAVRSCTVNPDSGAQTAASFGVLATGPTGAAADLDKLFYAVYGDL